MALLSMPTIQLQAVFSLPGIIGMIKSTKQEVASIPTETRAKTIEIATGVTSILMLLTLSVKQSRAMKV
jgi:hypothetical protein